MDFGAFFFQFRAAVRFFSSTFRGEDETLFVAAARANIIRGSN